MRWTGIVCILCLTAVVAAPAGVAASWMPGSGPYDVEKVVFPGHVFDAERLTASSALLLDINSGAVLFEMRPDESYGPASLSKIVTLALTYAALDEGEISLDDEVLISERAWSVNVPGSNMFIEAGTEVSMETLMRGMIVASGNDACVAVAEHISGTEDSFVSRMNELVRDIGMEDTVLHTVHGLHAEGQQITPRDVARLVRHFWLNYPEAEEITTERWFSHEGIEQPNRNGLLFRDDRVTGLKTGYTPESGYHFVATARDGDEYYAAVIMGVGKGEDITEQEGSEAREADAQRLLDWAFDTFTRTEVDLTPVLPAEMRVYRGQEREVRLRTEPENVAVTVPEGQYEHIYLEANLADELEAPVSRDDPAGGVQVFWRPDADAEEEDDDVGDERVLLAEAAVHPAEEIEPGGWWRRMWDSIVLFFTRLFR